MMAFEGTGVVGQLLGAFGIIFLTGIIATPFVPLRFRSSLSIITVVLIALVTSILAISGLLGNEIEYILNGGAFFGPVPLRIDALSAWFILIVNITSVTGILYGAGYLRSNPASSSVIVFHWILYIIFQASMILVCMVQHSIAFIVIWEIMSLSSFLLVIFDNTNPKVIKAGINYLVQMHISVVLLTVAFIWVYAATGTFDLRGIGLFFGSHANIWLFLLFFAGFGLKSGFIGLHTWLPQAHPAAPSHISGVMSGVIVKMGIYGIFRVITHLKADFLILGDIIITLSIITGLFGIMNAAVHRDFKKMLAYCTIENIGIIGVGIGLGLAGIAKNNTFMIFFGFGGALLHVLNHSLFKSLLFYSAGSVYNQTHTRNMDRLGGLIKKMPQTAILFLIGALAIGGVPPFNGFISEFLIYSGILKGFTSGGIAQNTLLIMTFAAMSIIGGISILAFTKSFGTIFLGSARQPLQHDPHEVPMIMLLPQYAVIFLMLGIALFPGYVTSLLGKILDSFLVNFRFDAMALGGYIGVMKSISLASFIFIGLIVIVFVARWLISRNRETKYAPTWGCGYVAPNAGMQYTGKSYSKTFGKLLNFIMIEKKGFTEIENYEIFPDSRKYRSFYLDVFESKIIDPALQIIIRFINHFQFIQNGKIQAYVIYGIVFILVIFIGTLLNLWH